jgi:RNA polymerase sigma-70 factor (ECF subfamily)
VTAPRAGDAARAVELVARSSYGRLVAYLASASGGDLAGAEDALGDALLAALRTWPEHGVPERPEAWLLTAARRRVVDAARRRDVATRAAPDVAMLLEEQATARTAVVPDKRLELLFACAHPAVPEGMRSPLMLQTVLGLDAARIAPAFLVPPTTLGQRLVRAKAKVREARAAFALPEQEHLAERLTDVLAAVYASYGAGWEDPAGLDDGRRGLTDEALRLAELLVELLPDEPEALGLLALLHHTEARSAARRDADGAFVPLDRQDVSLWSRRSMGRAEQLLAVAVRQARPGPYQLMAAIASVHNRRALTGSTDWPAICGLYQGLVVLSPTIGAHVAQAAAVRHVDGPQVALSMLDRLPERDLRDYQPGWVLRARCLADLGDAAGAAAAARRALGLTEDPAVRRHLQQTLGAGSPP